MNANQETNYKLQTRNKFNLEDRTLNFAKKIVVMCKSLPNNTVNFKLVDQLIRSSGSIGANYREANDCLGKKDFVFRLRISRKEAKETIFWLELVKEANTNFQVEINNLSKECFELKSILSAIINKVS